MKKVITFLLFPVLCNAQKTGGFASLGPSFLFKSSTPVVGGMLNVGLNIGSNTTIGPGMEFYKFKGSRAAYIPLYMHLKFYLGDNTARPYITIAPGYGIYNESLYRISVKGGFYIASSLGLHLRDIKKSKSIGPYIQAGIKHLSFNTTGLSKIESNENYFAVDFGIRF